MEMHLTQHMRLEQKMKLAPQIIQSIEILQLQIQDLQAVIDQELLENPTIEREEAAPEQEETAPGADLNAATSTTQTADPATPVDDTLQRLEIYEDEWKDYFAPQRGGGGGDGAADRKIEAMQNTPARTATLQEYVAEQFRMLDVPPRLHRLGEHIIFNIDRDGYLRVDLAEIVDQLNSDLRERADAFLKEVAVRGPGDRQGKALREFYLKNLDPDDPLYALREIIVYNLGPGGKLAKTLDEVIAPLRADKAQAEDALKIIHRLEPAGIGARNLQECLSLQLSPADPDYWAKRGLLEKHLDDISQNRFPKIARETGRTIEEINRLVGAIKAMKVNPGAGYAGDSVPYVVPDVVVELIEGRYEVRLEKAHIPRLTISQRYRDMMRSETITPELREFLRAKIESATRLKSAIEQRESTLQNVATEIVRVQQPFLDHGISHLRPLKMQEVADACGIHVSTVSRAISDKYMQTPRGIFPMKFFFTGATQSDEGDSQSRVSVISRIKDIIDNEDKRNPLSDGEIVDRLKPLNIARRTVTKYRKALKIPASRRRRVY
ncbi:MAG: RNA polymerase factor sigma-54 [Planctomycetes bacterium]|nr:RNA polymerase factor sigma-54 [Planctomycetota bacterium]